MINNSREDRNKEPMVCKLLNPAFNIEIITKVGDLDESNTKDMMLNYLTTDANEEAKEYLLKEPNFKKKMSKILVHNIFRNGVVEDIHSDKSKNLNNKDMKAINKDMMNKIYHLINALMDDDWVEIYSIYSHEIIDGEKWDEPEEVKSYMDLILEHNFNFKKTWKEIKNENN